MCSSIDYININDPDATVSTFTHGDTTINYITSTGIESLSTNSIGTDNIATAINVNGNVNCGGDVDSDPSACININGSVSNGISVSGSISANTDTGYALYAGTNIIGDIGTDGDVTG